MMDNRRKQQHLETTCASKEKAGKIPRWKKKNVFTLNLAASCWSVQKNVQRHFKQAADWEYLGIHQFFSDYFSVVKTATRPASFSLWWLLLLASKENGGLLGFPSGFPTICRGLHGIWCWGVLLRVSCNLLSAHNLFKDRNKCLNLSSHFFQVCRLPVHQRPASIQTFTHRLCENQIQVKHVRTLLWALNQSCFGATLLPTYLLAQPILQRAFKEKQHFLDGAVLHIHPAYIWSGCITAPS